MATKQAMDDVETAGPIKGSRSGGLWRKADGKVNQRRPLLPGLGGPNCHNPEPVTQAWHERFRSKAEISAWRRKSRRTGPRIRRPAGLARPRGEPRRAGHSVWLAYRGGGTGQSAAPYPQADPDRKRRAAAGRRQRRHPRHLVDVITNLERPAPWPRRRASGPAGGS